jgi:CDP-6-deoxy-D-xylo-4-hexulose-3-dehydrase
MTEYVESKEKEELRKKINVLLKEYYTKFMDKKQSFVPVSGKKYDEEELYAVTDALLDGWWTEGRHAKEFERSFAEFLGVKQALVVNSGSSANLVAFMALTSPRMKERRIMPGDEVITVAAGFPTTVNPIVMAGCIPVFCDVDLSTLNIRVDELEAALSKRTRAVMIAHTLGNPFDVDAVQAFCRKHRLFLVEDSCDALGSTYKGKKCGTFGDLATFSFYPAHHITMGEGGCVVTDDSILSMACRSVRDWGRDCYCATGKDNTCGKRFSWKLGDLPEGYDHKYIFSDLGYNLKNTDLNVALGIAQLKKLPRFIEARKENYRLLKEGLQDLAQFIIAEKTLGSDPSWFGFPMTIKEDAPFSRKEIIDHLTKEGIGTRLLFGGNLAKQPYFIDRKIPFRVAKDLKNTDLIMKNTFWVGTTPLIGKAEREKIIASIRGFVR